MRQDNFHASVQYNDSVGTAAADDHDSFDIGDYLEQKGLINDGEYLVGVKMFSGEVHGQSQNDPVYVTALVAQQEGHDNLQAAVDSGKPLNAREVQFEMSLNDFFGLFKRFEIAISRHGLIDRKDVAIGD